MLGEITILDIDPDAEDLARVLLLEGAVPESAVDDARHIAIAAVNEIDYLLTWNFAHMANTVAVPIIAEMCEQQGYSTPVITTPNHLIKEPWPLEDEVMREVHEARDKIAREHNYDVRAVGAHYENMTLQGFTYGIPGRTFKTEEELANHRAERNRKYERRKARRAATERQAKDAILEHLPNLMPEVSDAEVLLSEADLLEDPPGEYVKAIRAARSSGRLEHPTADHLTLFCTDLVIRARSGDQAFMVAAEVSTDVGTKDVDKASRSAALLNRVFEVIAIPLVVGPSISPHTLAYAEREGVDYVRVEPGATDPDETEEGPDASRTIQ